jgi:Flp pilus assembly protein protease CpaA
VIRGITLVGLLTIACVSDLRTRLIPNRIVVVTIAAGIVFAVVTKGDITGLTHAGAGLLTGFVVWFPFYLLRMLGAGDVKLFAASSTFLSARGAVEGALYTALFGGALALVYMILNSGWTWTFIRLGHGVQHPAMLRNVSPAAGRRMPYAVAISAGVLVAFWWPGHLIG